MQITLEINRDGVLSEIEQRTNYVGDKKVEDEGSYERIRTIDENKPELLMFWDEARTDLVEVMAGKIVSEGMGSGLDSDKYRLVLKVPDDFNAALQLSMTLNLFFYYVYGIIARWFMQTNKEECQAYSDISTQHLDKLHGRTLKRVFTRKGCL